MSEHYTVLAFDYGLRRIGVAVGQSLTATASPLQVLPSANETLLWQQLDALVAEWQPALFVLGLPLHADGSETPIHQAIKDFGNRLQARYNLNVEWIDERLSSREAEQLLLEKSQHKSRQTKHKASATKDIDHYAAKIILESWFRHKHSSGQTLS